MGPLLRAYDKVPRSPGWPEPPLLSGPAARSAVINPQRRWAGNSQPLSNFVCAAPVTKLKQSEPEEHLRTDLLPHDSFSTELNGL